MSVLSFIAGLIIGAQIVVVFWMFSVDREIRRLEKADLDEIAYQDALLEEMYAEEVKKNNGNA